ncbi:uncharacterized protein LOC142345086 [Convolutriloba macropyga]|uniref:uncharacterized protein LOC142345086 n=1 Tax=Convolutriloba macropyga TaxID=536237 RepID=UPI003F51FEC5
MANLPDFRFSDVNKQYLFGNTGIDTGTIHREVCYRLSTDSLLMIIRRFVSRRGYPDLIVTDNGKNFIGANQVMKLNFQRNYKPDNEIRLQLAQQKIQWTFNPPLASHFGGVWERLIHTVKRLLNQKYLASWEDCESTQRFRRNSQVLPHPYGYRINPKTSINPKPCTPTIVRCSGGSPKQVN